MNTSGTFIIPMSSLIDKPSKRQVLKFLSQANEYGNLGLFVGAGFSKTVLNNNGKQIALCWGELLEKAALALDIDYQSIDKTGMGYPEVATRMCEHLAEQQDIGYDRALTKLKGKLASLTAWYPEKTSREQYAAYLDALDPSWIITTNYDLVLESLLTGKCAPLGPSDSMHAAKGMTPIYHLHGIRSNPDTLIIAQEDYVSLFRPHEYRQLKLALTLKESTVLLLGYGLGDVNVLTALDWSKNVFSSNDAHYPHEVIQIVRKEEPKDKPYRDRNGIVIIEVCELADFFEEFIGFHCHYLEQKCARDEAVKALTLKLQSPGDSLIDEFIDDPTTRKAILKDLAEFPAATIAGFESFINKVLDQTWLRAKPRNAFSAYNQNLIVILDILTELASNRLPPALTETLAYRLDRLGKYIGHELGQSHAAAATFKKRKDALPKELIEELHHIAEQHGYERLAKLLSGL